jgi:hypothetical protein
MLLHMQQALSYCGGMTQYHVVEDETEPANRQCCDILRFPAALAARRAPTS